MANLNLSEFTEKLFVADADHTFIWDSAVSISKRVSRNSWLNSGTLTSDAPVTISQTWNAVGQTFKALVVNAAGTSDANSASGSLLADFQVGGVSKFSVRKDGRTTVGNVIVIGNSLFSWEPPYLRTYSPFSCTRLDIGAVGTVLLEWDAANTLALRNGAAAQTFNVYGTYTSLTDYKRLSLSCSASTGNATIGVPFNSVLAVTGGSSPSTTATITFAAQAAAFPVGSSVVVAGVTPSGYNGTYVVTASTTSSVSYTVGGALAAWSSGGTATVSGSANWILQSGGHLLAGTDNSFDIGAGGASRPRNVYVGTSIVSGSTIDAPYIRAGSAGGLQMQGRFFISSAADGNIYLTNNAATDFGRLQFGGTTNLFPSIKRSSTTLQARLADDSAFAPIQGKLTTETAFTATTVTPTGFITLYDSTGAAYKVPCVPA